MTSSIKTLASALRILAGDIQSPDNIPALCLMEAADRLEQLERTVAELRRRPTVDQWEKLAEKLTKLELEHKK